MQDGTNHAMFNGITFNNGLVPTVLSAATLAKMSVVGTGAKTIGAELSQVIPRDELPKRYGGEADAAAVGL